MVRLEDIVTIEVDKNYLNVRLMDDSICVVRGSMAKVVKRLPEFFFVACRNCMVNLAQISKVDAAARSIILTMNDGREIVVSRIQSRVFRRRFTL